MSNKIKNFVWRSCQNILPTKSNLYRKQVINSEVCELCDKSCETTSHVLLHFDFATLVWEACGLVIGKECTFEDLFWKLSNDSRPSAMDLTNLMAVSWNIWNNRNGIRHGEKPKTVASLILEATRFVTKYQSLQDYPISLANSLPTRWNPPTTGVYKANVDDAIFRDKSTAGVGVLLWDDKG